MRRTVLEIIEARRKEHGPDLSLIIAAVSGHMEAVVDTRPDTTYTAAEIAEVFNRLHEIGLESYGNM